MNNYHEYKVVEAARAYIALRGCGGSHATEYDALTKAVHSLPAKTNVDAGFACICGDDTEHKRSLDENNAVIESLGIDPASPNVVGDLLWFLHWNCGGFDVEGIGVDMWMGVVVESDTHHIYAQCDRIQHGLARIAQYIVDNDLAVDWDGEPGDQVSL